MIACMTLIIVTEAPVALSTSRYIKTLRGYDKTLIEDMLITNKCIEFFYCKA